MEVGVGVAERGVAEGQEPFHVPALDHVGLRVHVDRKVEQVGEHQPAAPGRLRARLEHVQALQDEDVGLVDDLGGSGQDVVGVVRVDRVLDSPFTRLHLEDEVDQGANVETLGEALALHEAPFLQDGVGVEEAVGGHEVHLGVVRPAREQLAQDAAGRALAHRDAAADADDVRHLGRQTAEEGRAGAVEILGAADVEVEKPRHRQIDLRDLVQRHVLVDAAQTLQFFLRQRVRRVGAQPPPRLLVEGDVDRVGERVDLVVGQETPRATKSRAGSAECRPCPR